MHMTDTAASLSWAFQGADFGNSALLGQGLERRKIEEAAVEADRRRRNFEDGEAEQQYAIVCSSMRQ